jgi:hypothetical protein
VLSIRALSSVRIRLQTILCNAFILGTKTGTNGDFWLSFIGVKPLALRDFDAKTCSVLPLEVSR